MKQQMMDALMDGVVQNKATTVIAAGAAASPVWLPWLKYYSEIAAALLPIAGIAWFGLQAVLAVMRYRREKG